MSNKKELEEKRLELQGKYDKNKNKLDGYYELRRLNKKKLTKAKGHDDKQQISKYNPHKNDFQSEEIIERFHKDRYFYQKEIKRLTKEIKTLNRIVIDMYDELVQLDFSLRKIEIAIRSKEKLDRYFNKIHQSNSDYRYNQYQAAGGCFFLCYFLSIGYTHIRLLFYIKIYDT